MNITWPRNVFTQRLMVRTPIIQAPMSGAGTPTLAAAVSNAGGVGMLTAGYLTPDQLWDQIQTTRELTSRPFAVNLFIHNEQPIPPESFQKACERLNTLRYRLCLPPVDHIPQQKLTPYKELLEVVLEEQVSILSFTYGVPPLAEIKQLRERGIYLMGTATNALEAIVLEESWMDAIILQGAEAGGPRASFLGEMQSGIGLMALVPQCMNLVSTPLIASGGIADGRSIMAALCLGAVGVQIGTALMATPESGTHSKVREKLLKSVETDSVLTSVWSGRKERVLASEFTRELQEYEPASFPAQHFLTQDLVEHAEREGQINYLPNWAGQGCGLCSAEPAGVLIQRWTEEVNAFFGQ